MSQEQSPGQAARVDAPQPPAAGVLGTFQKILRSIAIILIVQTVFKYAGSYIKAPLKEDVAKPDFVKASTETLADRVKNPSIVERDYSIYPRNVKPLWTSPATIDLDLYISEQREHVPSAEVPFISIKTIRPGQWNDVRKVTKYLDFPDNVLHHNGSLYAHIFAYKSPGSAMKSGEPELPDGTALRFSSPLTRFMPKKKDASVKRLIGSSSEGNSPAQIVQDKSEIISYYHTNFSLSLVGDAGTLLFDSIQPVIRPFITIQPKKRDETGMDGYYLPIITTDSFWLLRDHMYPINASVTRVPFHFELNQVSMMKMQIFNSLDQAFRQQAATMGGSGAEFEEIKRIFLETNVWLLGITVRKDLSLIRPCTSFTDIRSLQSLVFIHYSSFLLSRTTSCILETRKTIPGFLSTQS